MTLTGKDVYRAFRRVFPPMSAGAWETLPQITQDCFESFARELNKMLEPDPIAICAVRCPHCWELLAIDAWPDHDCQKGDA